ncbi:uncharacterized protein LOC127288789 [Leptopilina boulardi]|uniref:uncharacterized protein LOC127288789 n=1 Tax=Leptopilina boulardi TaxID=63433 RepID=UPI0021F57B17|nr:uncharacterized protein LOC127288789 [Leptopilina boulardi]XP_051172401.1 uncharacterized protein LOC127288789 [Leptopilina boulardi]
MRIFPNKGNNLFHIWKDIRQDIALLLRSKLKSNEDKESIYNIEELSEEQQDAVVLYLLPKLIRPSFSKYGEYPRAKKSDKYSDSSENTSKSTCNDIQESFIYVFEIFLKYIENL